MKTRPTTFLSHSKGDKEIIKRIADDLRTCRIDAWYDEWEIPPGISFQRTIFNDGIPNCDSFFIYLTRKSVTSYWVQKELDAFFVEQSRKRNVAIITFVDSDEIRRELPSDVASLNSPVINADNYAEGVTKLIARIYEAKLEKVLSERSLEEENARLKLEKEIESLHRQLLSIQSTGLQSLDYLEEKLSNVKFKINGGIISCVEMFRAIVPVVSTGATERFVRNSIIRHFEFPTPADDWSLEIGDSTPLYQILSPLIVNSLIEIQRPSPQYDHDLLYLSDLGKRFAIYLEDKA